MQGHALDLVNQRKPVPSAGVLVPPVLHQNRPRAQRSHCWCWHAGQHCCSGCAGPAYACYVCFILQPTVSPAYTRACDKPDLQQPRWQGGDTYLAYTRLPYCRPRRRLRRGQSCLRQQHLLRPGLGAGKPAAPAGIPAAIMPCFCLFMGVVLSSMRIPDRQSWRFQGLPAC